MSMADLVPTQDPRPWYMGRNGATNATRGEAQRVARGLLDSLEYQKSIKDRIKTGTLPAAVEIMLWHYAYGKPMEQIELNVQGSVDLSGLSSDELLLRAEALRRKIADIRTLEEDALSSVDATH